MSVVCPKCGTEAVGLDVASDGTSVFCQRCRQRRRLGRDTSADQLEKVDLSRPPHGAWYRDDGVTMIVGATHRSLVNAARTLINALFWNGIVAFFVALAISSTLHLFGFPTPSFFPKPVLNDRTMTVSVTIGVWIFLTPFIVIGMKFMADFVSSLSGQTEVTITPREAVIFSGVGKAGRRRRFDPATIGDVKIIDKVWRDEDGDWQESATIVLFACDNRRCIKLGTKMTKPRKLFVAAAIRKALERQRR